MLEIEVVIGQNYDELTNKFGVASCVKVRLEHSLVSLSKWESVWEEPFLGKKDKTQKQTLSYVEMMVLDEIPPEVFSKLLDDHLEEIKDYVAAKMTATTINSDPNAPQNREIVTSELIYYWMITMNIPVQFENWHLNRLLTLVQVINLKNSPKKKMSGADRRALNRSRLAERNTRG